MHFASMRSKVHKLKIKDTKGLPFMLGLLINKPHIIRKNIDVTNGLVNGAIGILQYIEYDVNKKIIRLWLKFENPSIGLLAKLKVQSYVKSNPNINENWVPISKQSANISLKSKILKCKRTTFPLTEACAITIHKSQGPTYFTVIHEYDKNHDQQLVYVAMSRATTLYLTNKNYSDFNFYHAKGRINKELQNEFMRLENHFLVTISDECHFFLQTANDVSFITLNVQSLKAHRDDIITDFIIPTVDILILTETWLENHESIDLPGYVYITQFKRQNNRVGGVIIYEKKGLQIALVANSNKNLSNLCGDICNVVGYINKQKILFIAIYITPNTSMENIQECV